MNTLCFLTDLSSSEWAAWGQAVGSILAVGAAFLVGYNQNKTAMKLFMEEKQHTQKAASQELRQHQIGAGTRALFTMWRQLNLIAQIQEDVTNKYRDYPPAPLAMPPIMKKLDDSIRLNIDSLAFLLDHGKSDLLVNICIAETRFLDALDIIQRRSALHANEVQPMVDGKKPRDRNLTPDELREIIGIRLFQLLISLTHEMISKTDDAVATIEAVEADLYSALKTIFPETSFPHQAPMDGETASAVKPPRPTGLL